jgi:DEAD/DEAH box helicase domain-containing protein
MSLIDALKSSEHVRDQLVEFALQSHFLERPHLHDALRRLWSGPAAEGGLANELWIEGAFAPASQPDSLESLAQTGVISRDLVTQLDSAGVFPRERAPYAHQLDSIKAAKEGYAAVVKPTVMVSAATGAGKTECFLLPLLDELYRNPPTEGEGVSAIILYPMNALVTDQVDRLMAWLKGQDRITAFHFTSETPEDAAKADANQVPAGRPWTFRSRQHARGLQDESGRSLEPRSTRCPQILVTNYSMLEYMLCRPQDGVFFGRNLKTIVLDEAHLYTGNLAAELSLLLRRAFVRAGRTPEDVLAFATSATIQDDDRELVREFASKLFSKPDDTTRLIVGRKSAKPVFPAVRGRCVDVAAFAESPIDQNLRAIDERNGEDCLTELTPSTREWLAADLAWLGLTLPATIAQVGPALHACLLGSVEFTKALELLHENGRLSIGELTKGVWGDDDPRLRKATQKLLTYGAMARERLDSLPHLPNRIHYMLRPPDGVSVSFLGGDTDYYDGFKIKLLSPYSDVVGQTMTLARELQTGRALLVGLYEVKDGRRVVRELPAAFRRGRGEDGVQLAVYEASPPPTGIEPVEYLDPVTGILHRHQSAGLVPLFAAATEDQNNLDYFWKPPSFYLSATTGYILHEMPAYAGDSRDWKPGLGRRLLVFSDNRKEAAKLGCELGMRHEEWIVRKIITNEFRQDEKTAMRLAKLDEMISVIDGDPELLRMMLVQRNMLLGRKNVAQIVDGMRSGNLHGQLFSREHAAGHLAENWNQRIFELNKLRISENLGQIVGNCLWQRPRWPSPSLESAGLLKVRYPGLGDVKMPADVRMRFSSDSLSRFETLWSDYLAGLLDQMRSRSVVTLQGIQGASDQDTTGESSPGKWICRDSVGPGGLNRLCATPASTFYKFTHDVITNLDLKDANGGIFEPLVLLGAAFDVLHAHEFGWLEKGSRETGSGGGAPAFRIRLCSIEFEPAFDIFRCAKTLQVVPRNVANTYPGAPRNTKLVPVTQAELDSHPRLRRFREAARFSPVFDMGIWSEEHTAQLDPRENRRIQDLFKVGARNLLSSTTTLELGIDIGGLKGVLLGNVPPGKANYLQRAGRAGRRADGSSLVTTFCRGSTYEREVFLNFGDFLGRPLRKPTVLLGRDAIMRRHLFAFLINEFFRSRPVTATGAMTAYQKMGVFCGVPAIERAQSAIRIFEPANNIAPIYPEIDRWLQGLDLESYLQRLLLMCSGNDGYAARITADLGQSLVGDLRRSLKVAVTTWCEDYDQLVESWRAIRRELVPSDPRAGSVLRRLNAIHAQARMLFSETTISSLSEAGVLPRYGFPIGLNSLKVVEPNVSWGGAESSEHRTKLERSSLQALREYVPGSCILVGGRYVKSSGLLLHWTGQAHARADDFGLGAQYSFAIVNGGLVRGIRTPDGLLDLPAGDVDVSGVMLIPRHGYTTAATEPPSYHGRVNTVGHIRLLLGGMSVALPSTGDWSFGGTNNLSCTFDPEVEIFGLSSGEHNRGYAICHACGYSESERLSAGPGDPLRGISQSFRFHTPLSSDRPHRCMGRAQPTVLRNIHLGADQKTHACIFRLRADFVGYGRYSLNALAQALRLAACRMLELDVREISILEAGATNDIVVFESAAGGAGHLQELYQGANAARWVEEAKRILSCSSDTPPSERTLMLRLLTADCPMESSDGTPKLDCLSARRILRGEPFVATPKQSDAVIVPIPPRPRRRI